MILIWWMWLLFLDFYKRVIFLHRIRYRFGLRTFARISVRMQPLLKRLVANNPPWSLIDLRLKITVPFQKEFEFLLFLQLFTLSIRIQMLEDAAILGLFVGKLKIWDYFLLYTLKIFLWLLGLDRGELILSSRLWIWFVGWFFAKNLLGNWVYLWGMCALTQLGRWF